MGTWEGHVSSGLAFYAFGILFCFQNSWRFLTKGRKYQRKSTIKTTIFGKIFEKFKSFPVDSIMKIGFGFGAALGEFFYPPGTNKFELVKNGQWMHMNEWQHFTMFTFFMMSGIVDIVSQKVLKHREIAVEKAFLAIPFYVTALLFYYHVHGKEELELESHQLLLYANLGICVSLTLEVWRPFDQKLIWLHTLLVMQMGSWLFHLVFILFKPIGGEQWESEDMGNLMVLPIFYGWHIFFNCCIMATIHVITWVYYKFKVNTSYLRVHDSEMQCCIPSQSDYDERNGGTFSQDEDYDAAIEKDPRKMVGYHNVPDDEETAFMM